jgi:hypothetical protein
MHQEHTRPQIVRIQIDKQLYESPTPTNGSSLYLLAHLPGEMHLYKEGLGHDEDSLIANDSTAVDLKNGDHFRSVTPGMAETTIYVNTDPVVWSRTQISYDELVKLAFPDGPFEGNVRYSITWTKPDGSEGAVLKGGKIKVIAGMKFDVRNTDKS